MVDTREGPSQPLEPVFFVGFDQRIDPAGVLETIRVTAGSRAVPVSLASQAQIQQDKQVSQLVKYAQEGRWLAFRAQEPLPADKAVQVTIGPGTPSAEGPLLTTEAQSFSFSTYAPLRIEGHGCSWGGDECHPLTPLYIRFNNELDTHAYAESLVTVQPEIPGARIQLIGDTLQIRGATRGSTTYTVVVSAELECSLLFCSNSVNSL